jgi:flagellar protein FliO/FliZ
MIPYSFAQSAPLPGSVDSPVSENLLREAERGLSLESAGGGGGGPAAGEAGSISGIFRLVLTLALAAAAIYGCVYVIRRASRRLIVRDPFLKVLASAPLGANRYAHVVALGSKAWLVGAAEGGVSLIGEIEDKDTLDALFLEDSRKSAAVPPGRLLDFKAILRRLGMPADSGAAGADNIRKRRERLKGL